MRKKRPSPPAALTDIAFLLLLFFLILAIEAPQYTLPKAQQVEIVDTSSIPTIEILDSTLLLDNTTIALEDIPYQKQYILKTGQDTPYRLIQPIMDHLTELGVEKLSCLVEEAP